MADSTLPLMDNLHDLDRELSNVRHWLAFDLAQECAVGYHQARAALEACAWDVDRARRQLQADTAALDDALDVAIEKFNVQVGRDQIALQARVANDLAHELGVPTWEAWRTLDACQWSVTKARRKLEAAHVG